MASRWTSFPDAPRKDDPWTSFPDAARLPADAPRKQAKPDSGPPLESDPVTGAKDGDTLSLRSGRGLRVWGVDAPEMKQPGYDEQGKPVPIGQLSQQELMRVLARAGSTIAQQQVGESYGRPVAPVSVDGNDLGFKLTSDGYALAAPDYLSSDPQRRFDYLQNERLARQNQLGIHKTRFQNPADFRRDPQFVEMPGRETIPRFWDTPTPESGMRPEVETRFVQMMNDPKVSEEEVANYAKANGGFLVDPVELKRNREISRQSGKPIGLGYKDAPQILTDLGDGALGAAARGFTNGVLPNMLEETGAAADTLGATPGRENVWNSDRRLADIWANNARQNESITAHDSYAYPKTTIASELAGGLVPVSRVRTAGDLMKLGAGYGFVSGFGQPGTLPERLTSGAIGGGEGLVLTTVGGKALEKAAPYIGKGMGYLGEKAAPVYSRWRGRFLTGLPIDAPRIGEAVPMAADALPSVAQNMPSRPKLMDQPMPSEQLRAAADGVAPSDVLPIPGNQVSGPEELAAIEAGRFRRAAAPNERIELSRQTFRTWNGGEVAKVGPTDLVGWMRLRGGLMDQGGELSHMGLTNAARRGMDFVGQESRFGPLVNNESGMSLDDAALRAWEEGYFPELTERPSVNEFLDGLRGTHDGYSRRFRADDADQIERYYAAQQDRHALQQQRDEAGQVWVDSSFPASDQPFAPVEAYHEWPAGGPDFAGNINLGKLESPQDISRALDFTERRIGFDAATRGRVAQAETERLAGEMNMTPDALLARRSGQAFNAEEALAARQILAKSGNELVNMAKRVRSMDEPGDDVLAEFRQAWTRHAAIQEQVAGATAEAGRTLAQFRMLAKSGAVRRDVLSAMVNNGGGRDRIKDVADVLIDAFEESPGKFNALSEQLAKPRFKDKAIELYYNMMLSGPATHVVNITSNTLTALGQLPEHATAAMFGKGRELLAGQAVDRVTSSEVGRRAFGMLQGFKEGIAQFVRTARTGETSDLVSKVEAQHQEAISGFKGKVIRTPSRLLSAEDELFKAVARRMELNGDAARIAHKEGFKGEEAKARIAQLVANPTDDMLARSFDYGRYLTFQRPLGNIAGNVARMRNDSVLMTALVPFVRTPTNLLKFAAERSPAAPLLKDWRADFIAGGARRDLAVSRAMLGTGFAATVYQAALEGRISGAPPSDPAKSQFMRADGWQPYSIKLGDKWYSYARLDPFATTIGVAADLATKKDGMTQRQLDDYAMMLTASIIKNMGDKTWLSSASDFLGALDDPERNGPAYLRKMAAGAVTPALSAQVARAVDPVTRDTRTVGDAVKARIPFVSRSLPAKRDIWGKEIVGEGGIGPDFMSPVRQSTELGDPINREMLASGARFDQPDRYIMRDGKRVDLTPQQYEAYSARAGQNTRQAMEQLVAQPNWANTDADARAAAIKKAATQAKKDARETLFGGGDGKVDAWSSFPSAKVKADPWANFKGAPQRDIVSELNVGIPGVGMTSGFRTKEYQEDMRRRGYHPAHNSMHLDGSSLDLTPPAGKSMEWLRGQVRRLYPDARMGNEGDHLHVSFPGWFGAPAIGGARSAGLVNPNARQ